MKTCLAHELIIQRQLNKSMSYGYLSVHTGVVRDIENNIIEHVQCPVLFYI